MTPAIRKTGDDVDPVSEANGFVVHPKSVNDAMTSHPIPARGETTPTDEPPTLRSLWGKYPGLERADDDAELLAQIAALTSEVSALREAVDAFTAAVESDCYWTDKVHDAFNALRAARQEGK